MAEGGLAGFFEKYLQKAPLFLDKGALQSSYIPSAILHRDEQIKAIANILAPALRMERPSNMFVYGKTGTGKTLSVKYTLSQINEVASSRKIPIKTAYINCKLKKVADTEYRLLAQLVKEFGETLPETGLPTDTIYKSFFNLLEKEKKLFILVLDEIDHLIKKAGDSVLYNLTRINSEIQNSQLSLIGISNDLVFIDGVDPRARSSLSEEEVLFPPYNALQLQQILRARAKKAFKEGAMGEGVIEKCAAYAAREHGDARRALDLLRVAGEIAERENAKKIKIKHLDIAEQKIEKDRMQEIVLVQPRQFQAVLYSALICEAKQNEKIFTGGVYTVYKGTCEKCGLSPLTQRRFSDILAEMDMLGVINARIISNGRYGRTREISIPIPPGSRSTLVGLLKEAIGA